MFRNRKMLPLLTGLFSGVFLLALFHSLSFADHGRRPYQSEVRVQRIHANAYPGDRFPIDVVSRGEFVERIFVTVDRAFGDDNGVIVRVDGESFGPFVTPFRERRPIDPTFEIALFRVVSNVTLQVVGRDGIYIREVQIYTLGDRRAGGGGSRRPWNQREMESVAAFSWDLVETIRHLQVEFLNPDEFKADFLPIKKQAAQVYAASMARGDTSRTTYFAAMCLVKLIDDNRLGLEELMERDGAYEAIVNILRIREALADLYE